MASLHDGRRHDRRRRRRSHRVSLSIAIGDGELPRTAHTGRAVASHVRLARAMLRMKISDDGVSPRCRASGCVRRPDCAAARTRDRRALADHGQDWSLVQMA
jgi:hypothetical protein